MDKHVQPSINKRERAPLQGSGLLKPVLLDRNYKLRLTLTCLPTFYCLATFPLSDVIHTSFALFPGNRTTFMPVFSPLLNGR